MGLRPHELLGSSAAPHELSLDLSAGSILSAPAPFPSAEVVSNDSAPVRQLVYQTLRLRARPVDDPDAPAEEVILGRLVAVLDSGAEVEILRDALPADVDDPEVDTSRCESCGGPILSGEKFQKHDGKAYHDPRCWRE